MATVYTIDVAIALNEGEELTPDWWIERYCWGAVRAGGMPPEVADPLLATLEWESDPDSGERFARISLQLPAGTSRGRANELSHMLTSQLAAVGYTLLEDGKPVTQLPGEQPAEPTGEFGGTQYTDARVCSHNCMACVVASDTRYACCTQGSAFSLADIGSALAAGDEAFVQRVLAQPGEMDGIKYQPYLRDGRCVFHDPSCGCTLPLARMPLQCRTYLCAPERLLPPDLLADYHGYVDALEEQEAFVEDHMRYKSKVDFGSPLDQVKEAAVKAFAAWAAGEGDDE